MTKQSAANRNLGQLEGDGAGMADDPRTDFDQPGLQAAQRTVGHLLGKVCAL